MEQKARTEEENHHLFSFDDGGGNKKRRYGSAVVVLLGATEKKFNLVSPHAMHAPSTHTCSIGHEEDLIPARD